MEFFLDSTLKESFFVLMMNDLISNNTLIGNNKNGYLNECYAQRYGAQVLNEGFCKNDETVKGSCDSPAYSLGNCQQSFTGASFNQASGECEAVTLVGCSADMPFESLEACQSSCS